MNELDPVTIGILGMIAPPILSIINRVRWQAHEKALISAAFAIALGIFAAWYDDALTREGLASSCIAVYTWLQVTYHGFFKPTGLSPAIEKAILPGTVIGAPVG